MPMYAYVRGGEHEVSGFHLRVVGGFSWLNENGVLCWCHVASYRSVVVVIVVVAAACFSNVVQLASSSSSPSSTTTTFIFILRL